MNRGGNNWKELYARPGIRDDWTPAALDHFSNPRNAGVLEDPDGMGSCGDPACGDHAQITIRLEGDVIAEIAFVATGCPGAIATSSAVTEIARGLAFRDALLITDDDVIARLGGIPENKAHCSLLGVAALREAISDAVLMKSLVEHGVLGSKEEYRALRKQKSCGFTPDHSCDGTCGSQPASD